MYPKRDLLTKIGKTPFFLSRNDLARKILTYPTSDRDDIRLVRAPMIHCVERSLFSYSNPK